MKVQGRKNGARPIWRITLTVAVIVLMVLGQATAVYGATAQDLQDELNQINERINQTQSNLKEVERNRQYVQRKLREYESEVARTSSKLRSLEDQLSVTEREVAQAAAELKEAEKKQAARQDLLRRRIRAIAEYGNVSYLEVLFEATSFSDFLSRFQTLQQVITKDMALLQAAAEEKRQIAIRKAAWEDKQKQLADLRGQTQVVQASYQELQSNHEKQLNSILRDKQKLQAALDQEMADSNRLADEIRRLQSSNGSSRTLSMVWPTPGYAWITDPFGMRINPILGTWTMHNGMDIGAPYGARIVAAESGKVILAQWYGAYGNAVVLDHGGGTTTLYGHSSKLLVSVGQSVTRGQTIAYIGSTGWSTGPHLHFEVRKNGKPVNPAEYVRP